MKILMYCTLAVLLAVCHSPNSKTRYIDTSAFDTSVRPQDDFFAYANGGWIAKTEIPPSESRWGSFDILNDKATMDIYKLLNDLSNSEKHHHGSSEQFIADLFRSSMDSMHIESLGITPIQEELKRIQSIESPTEILPHICHQITSGLVPLRYSIVPNHIVTFYVYQDNKNSEQQVAHFDQGRLGLPNNEYYLKSDSSSVATQNHYKKYIANLLVLAGSDSLKAIQQSEAIYSLEYKLAKASRSPVEMRDPILNYNKIAISTLRTQMPGLKWEEFIGNLGIRTDTVLVGQPDYYSALNTLLYSESLEAWKQMLHYRIIQSNASLLSHAFVQANFDFYGKILYGNKAMKPRWKRMANMVNAELGDALGKLYVERYFPPEAKERMDTLVSNLLRAYGERIQSTAWMSDSTKQKALLKLSTITRKIGYPVKWKDYDNLTIMKDSYFMNIRNTRSDAYLKMIAKLGQPVDKDAWLMTPPTVNAYYSPSNNEIVFPAGILQPPFFNKDADDAINYGAIGMVIAHEITHGFDDKGRKYDAHGNLNEWWTHEDSERYDTQAEAIISQFNGYEVLEGLFLNGELTQGENIADLGGLLIAYDAFKKTEQGQSNYPIDGFIPDQRFFLAYAMVWMEKSTNERLRQQVLIGPHSPARYRVNGPLKNMDAFHKAFNLQAGDSLYTPDSLRVQIW